VADFRPQVALIGLVAAEIDGVTLSEQLAAGFPNLKIVLTGEEVPECILRLLLRKGVACDTLEVPFERKQLLDMMGTWVSGLDYIDEVTHLRNAEHFRMELLGTIGVDNLKPTRLVNYPRASIIFIELCERASSHLTLENEGSFLRSLAALLVGYTQECFAYRCGVNQFALLLNARKDEAFCSAKWLMADLKSLLRNHDLIDHHFPALGVLSLPEVARSIEHVEEAGRQLLARAKNTETNIAVLEPFEPNVRDTWTDLYTERFFMEALHAEWKRSERNKRTFSLIDIDLGDLDALLGKTRDWMRFLFLQIGDTINAACRRSDVPCHYNLAEFLILLPETPIETACGLAQQLHSRLKDAVAYALSGYRPPLTLSVATYPFDGTTPVDLIHSLDDAMLLLKNATRDGVAAASKGVLSPQ
jgi:diguanylate cyclase (GGDEF)-like protein